MNLKTIKTFQHQDTIYRFSEKYGVSLKSAKIIFRDLMCYLWLSQKVKIQKKEISVLAIWEPVDQMWHTFLQYSSDYAQFCKKYFGKFIHHEPETSMALPQVVSTPQEIDEYIELFLKQFGYRDCIRWFSVYPKMSSRFPFKKKKYKTYLDISDFYEKET